MKIQETHSNGASIAIHGVFGVRSILMDWRNRQDNKPAEAAPPSLKTGFHPVDPEI